MCKVAIKDGRALAKRKEVGCRVFLIKVSSNLRNVEPTTVFLGWMSKVRVDILTRGCAQTKSTLFFGKLDQLLFDTLRWVLA